MEIIIGRQGNKIKAPLHSLLGGFQPKPYHNAGENHLQKHKRIFLPIRYIKHPIMTQK